MEWKQDKPFDLNKMGHEHLMCLKNVRLAYGIPAKYASAKDAMLANKNAGTLHPIDTLPKNVAVPVFVDTSSIYEHVEVADKGVFYSDGKKVTNPYSQKFFGWGETLNGVRIVEAVKKKTNEELADEVLAGKWGNGEERKRRLTEAGYNYSAVQAIVVQKVYGNDIRVGSKVTLINWVDYNGRRLVKTRPYYFVKQIVGDRVVLSANSISGPVYAAVKKNNLRKA